MKIIKYLAVIQLFTLLSLSVWSNNIAVTSVSLEDQVAAEHYVFIEFNIGWENSWRTTSVPNNWDAAWVFCKYRVAGGEWHHVYIHNTGHTAPSGATIDVADDTTGAFIYRSSEGSGTNIWLNARLRWDYGNEGINDDAALEVKVFAVEMVYVPQGAFYLGDSTANSRFFAQPNNKSFYNVTSEDPISVGSSSGYLWATGGISSGTIPSSYPKGYNAFYLMKYEISQEQYIEFLNTLTRAQQDSLTESDISETTVTNFYVMSNTTFMVSRNGIRCDATLPDMVSPVEFYADLNETVPGNETVDGQNIVSNFLSWPDFAAYLDWSGLRPMTELEFEKACRGPNNPVGGEFAWGNTLIHDQPYTVSNGGEPGEVINSLPQNTGNCNYFLTKPNTAFFMRCGIFAASSVNHSRMETGATYYGNMEMSGNTTELIVNAYGAAGRSFTGLHGDGTLLPTGYADTDYWPGINGNDDDGDANTTYQTEGVSEYAGAGARGGNLADVETILMISNRTDAIGAIFSQRKNYRSGRGCRTSP